MIWSTKSRRKGCDEEYIALSQVGARWGKVRRQKAQGCKMEMRIIAFVVFFPPLHA